MHQGKRRAACRPPVRRNLSARPRRTDSRNQRIPDTHADFNADTDREYHCNQFGDSDPNPVAFTNANINAYADTDAECYAERVSNPDPDPDQPADRYSDAQRYANRNAQRDSQPDADALAIAHTDRDTIIDSQSLRSRR